MTFIYCLGPSGTFSMNVAQRYNTDNSLAIKPVKAINEVFENVCQNKNTFGVIPVENTIAGIVGIHQDLLIEYNKKYNVNIVSEIDCPVKFGILSNCQQLSEINYLYAHPHAIEQCQIFKLNNLPQAQIKYTKSTIVAADYFLDKKDTDKIGAIVPLSHISNKKAFNSFFHHLNKSMGIQDTSMNITRFFIIKSSENKIIPDFSKQKTSIFIETLKDEAALLFNILSPFANLKINMSFLHSRSSLKTPWIYNFFIDFINTPNYKNDSKLLIDILNRFEYINITILGTYNSDLTIIDN